MRARFTKFDRMVRETFAPILEPHGFECTGSDSCTFYREHESGFVHLIMPDPLRRTPKYDVKVFPHHRELDQEFDLKFPDNLSVTTGIFCYLAKSGVATTGAHAFLYACAPSFSEALSL